MRDAILRSPGVLSLVLVTSCSSSSSSPAAAVPSPAPTTAATMPLVGCAHDRPAVAHTAGGTLIAPQPSGAPIPCASTTGAPTYDPTLVITPSGKLLFGPANAPGLTSSTDEGMTWLPIQALPNAPSGTLLHPWLWNDTAAHRIFFNMYSLGAGTCSDGSGATLWFSDDEGASWTSQPVGCGSDDWGKVITGPPATAASKAALTASGYPDMVYYCATGPTAIVGPDHICYRSTDGGKTFVVTATHPVATSDGYPTAGAVGPDGTLYVPKGSPKGLAITMSKDEGDTWTDVVIPGSRFVGTSAKNWLSSSVQLDAAGNLYAVWSDDKNLRPYIAFSKDQGATWSSPIGFGAPGVETSAYPNLTIASPGYVAIAYYGSLEARTTGDGYFTSDNLPYSAYLAVTPDLFGSAPVFYSATFNDPASPVFTGLTYQVSEYAGYPVFASDGTIWATYLSGGNGLAGRLTFPTAGRSGD